PRVGLPRIPPTTPYDQRYGQRLAQTSGKPTGAPTTSTSTSTTTATSSNEDAPSRKQSYPQRSPPSSTGSDLFQSREAIERRTVDRGEGQAAPADAMEHRRHGGTPRDQQQRRARNETRGAAPEQHRGTDP